MIPKAFAEKFAKDWIDSWNRHDVDGVLSYYAEDFEMTSPLIIQIAGESSGKLKGKGPVAAYWLKALRSNSGLHFELLQILIGVESVTLYYRNTQGHFSAEVLHFNSEGKVAKAFAHYY
jgi:SnoaL-like protein